MAGIKVSDSIVIHGEDGRHEIQLCFGDITKLQKRDEVDVVMVSAFSGTYSAVPGTLIGALKREFHLSVQELSKHKAEDLRKDFRCWISHELPDNLPYRRLICYEQKSKFFNSDKYMAQSIDREIGYLFRAFSTLFDSSDDISVITPLLGTGCQNFSSELTMNAMVKTCATWMRAGMPLKLLKIVVFVQDLSTKITNTFTPYLRQFSKLKSVLETAEAFKKCVPRTHDAMMIFNSEDKAIVNSFIDYVKEEISQLNTIREEIENDDKEEIDKTLSIGDWSSKMTEKMLDAKKVVCFLSPKFLSNKTCIDSYNLAMCLSRKWQNSLLAPVYLDTMPYVPTYLTLTQWIDCRVKGRDVDVNKLQMGATILGDLISKTSKELNVSEGRTVSYDVFISYSHRDTDRVLQIVNALTQAVPKLRIFIDKEELKTGFSWQAALYSALSCSSLVIAFLSPRYLASKMCQEEFAIASSQHVSKELDSQLVAVALESLGDAKVAPMYSSCPCLKCDAGDEHGMELVCSYVKRFMSSTPAKQDALHMNPTLRKARQSFMERHWKLNKDTKRMEFKGPPLKRPAGAGVVVICCHPEEGSRAIVIQKMLRRIASTTKSETAEEAGDDSRSSAITVNIVSEDSTTSHNSMESADLVLLMLSASFCTQPSTRALLQVALALARSGKSRLQAIIVSALPRLPSVLHLLPAAISLEDQFWSQVEISSLNGYPLEIAEMMRSQTFWRFAHFNSLGVQLSLRLASEWVLHCMSDHEGNNTMASVTGLCNLKASGYYCSAVFQDFNPKFLQLSDVPSEQSDSTLQDVSDTVSEETAPEAAAASMESRRDLSVGDTEMKSGSPCDGGDSRSSASRSPEAGVVHEKQEVKPRSPERKPTLNDAERGNDVREPANSVQTGTDRDSQGADARSKKQDNARLKSPSKQEKRKASTSMCLIV